MRVNTRVPEPPMAPTTRGSVRFVIDHSTLSAARFASRRSQSPADDNAGDVERGRVVTEDEVGVRGEDDAVELERERVRVLVRGELVLLDRDDDELADQTRQPALERGDPLFDRPWTGAHLQGGTGEEAAPWEGSA